MKVKSLEEVTKQRNKLADEIEKGFKIQTILIAILIILTLVICFKSMKLAIDYEVLNKEKKELEDLIQIQNYKK